MTKLQVVTGGQYGSEAKGHVTARLVKQALFWLGERQAAPRVLNLRVAGPNAGHTVYAHDGSKFALRQVPVGWVLGADCAIAAGSEIDPDVLDAEITAIQEWATRTDFELGALYIDPEATILRDQDKADENQAGIVTRIGSTGKGIGAARVGRIRREVGRRLKDNPQLVRELEGALVTVADVADLAHEGYYGTVIVEGAQGYGLGLHAGHYPQCTSSDCRAIDFLSMAGINPWHRAFRVEWLRDVRGVALPDFEVWVVARMYPIRVAGNSGPMESETTWQDLGLPEERTTVTQKIRRVGQWDPTLLRKAVEANGGAPVVRVALTMVDQKWPALAGVEQDAVDSHPTVDVGIAMNEFTLWAARAAEDIGAPIRMVTTGPNTGFTANITGSANVHA